MSRTPITALEAPVISRRRRPLAEFFGRLVREKPLGTFGGIITLIFIATAIFSELLAPYDVNDIGVGTRLSPSSWQHWMGVDHLGRDVFSRIIFGARISVIIGLSATAFSIVVSTLIGTLSGFIGGKLDLIVQRFVDAWISFPGLLVLIVVVTVTGPGMQQVIIVLGILYGIGGSRIVRSAVLGVKQNDYILAARAIGTPTHRTLMWHIVPNIMAPIIVLFTTRVPSMILYEATLSFLGLGIPPPAASWGRMLSMEGRRYMVRVPMLAIWPGAALSIVVYGVNMFGDAVRDLLDPRMRGSGGRFSGKSK